jgi:hypothetical protein
MENNALELALGNVAYNAKTNGDTIHIENLDSIADPTQDEPVSKDLTAFQELAANHVQPTQSPRSRIHHTQLAADEIISGWNELNSPQRLIREEFIEVKSPTKYPGDWRAFESIATQISNLNAQMSSRLSHAISEIESIKATINTAAQSMPQEPDLKHRSLHEWDDQYLINELVERENALMPFYYELLKRIGSPDLHSLVMSSMQGKNNSMVTLAQLCAAMGSMVQGTPPQAPKREESMSREYDYQEAVMNQVPPQSPNILPTMFNPYPRQ